ncbi:MAG: type II toxin-antitoxin system VapC family toxin [Gemmatimonadetes bacterium]|nr:type II toxin-antitoxin system VapC family toxin [Gemmatimonadota bacterium]MCH7565071.1 type II toxin-antitoxin system VapC family toxin [Gemmatimonadota bacterium]
MNVVDSSGWIEYFVGGPNAGFFEQPLHEIESLLVPSVTVLEVYRYVLRERGRGDALTVAAAMRQGRVIDLDQGLAIEAADLGANHGLPLADSIIYASALVYDATLWTQDADFEGLDQVEYRAKA